jgi:hypothetical protein
VLRIVGALDFYTVEHYAEKQSGLTATKKGKGELRSKEKRSPLHLVFFFFFFFLCDLHYRRHSFLRLCRYVSHLN